MTAATDLPAQLNVYEPEAGTVYFPNVYVIVMSFGKYTLSAL